MAARVHSAILVLMLMLILMLMLMLMLMLILTLTLVKRLCSNLCNSNIAVAVAMISKLLVGSFLITRLYGAVRWSSNSTSNYRIGLLL